MEPYDVRTLLLILGDIRDDIRTIRSWIEEDNGEEEEEADG